MKKPNHKHMNLSDRIFIETSLNQNLTFKEIGAALGKDPTTISREVRKHRILSEGWVHGDEIPCAYVRNCRKKNMCVHKCNVLCKDKTNCRCYKRCKYFKDIRCKSTHKPPYVCNNCSKKQGCRKAKYYYRAKNAYDEYKATLSDSRVGINMEKEEFDRIDKLISTLLKAGQPISHIVSYLGDEIPVCERTIYYYFERGILTADSMDLPRKVKYKLRKKHYTKDNSDKDNRYNMGRKYSDFLEYTTQFFDTEIVEMDTVFGARNGSNVLLTMLFRRSCIMLIFLMEDCSQISVSQEFLKITDILGPDDFAKTFPILLTDNGKEFKHWKEYLPHTDYEPLSEIFFCDPNSAFQKGRIEKNHEYIRYFLPKGTSFSSLTHDNVRLMMNHINSTRRPSLNGKHPYELGLKLLPDKLVSELGLKIIPDEQVCLDKSLFGTL